MKRGWPLPCIDCGTVLRPEEAVQWIVPSGAQETRCIDDADRARPGLKKLLIRVGFIKAS